MAVFNHTKHKELWNWLADHPGSLKKEWPGWSEEQARNYCFACETVGCIEGYCEAHCPLRWESNCKRCCDNGASYNKWWLLTAGLRDGAVQAKDLDAHREEIRQAALAVANLPLREIEGIEVI